LITRIVWCSHMQKCDFYTHSVISTRKVWFQHAQEWFLHAKCNVHPHSVILHAECNFHKHTSVILTRMRVNIHSWVWLRHARKWFIHAECYFYTQSVIPTRSVILSGTNMIRTRMSVISTRPRLISTRRVRFPHAECDFTQRMWFRHTRE
jgi:hypothetical protein